MGYTFEIESIISYVEERVKSKIDFSELEKTLNYSYRHIRGIFKRETDISLSKYILSRKIAYCAHEIYNTKKSLTAIAYEYNVGSYDTFSRAFKRETGIKPSGFKGSSYICGIKHICMGTYAPAIFLADGKSSTLEMRKSVTDLSTFKNMDACILYGVSKVHYGRKANGGLQFAPFPMCLNAVLTYLGQEVNYAHLMVATCASYRLTWNKEDWDLRAVDERNIHNGPRKTFELAFDYIGRDYKILDKETDNYSKNDFIKFIKTQVDLGHPLIALGVVGPPDACIVTGYKENGDVLLGWSLVQDHLEFNKDISIDPSGYFECRHWWDKTEMIMSLGNINQKEISLKELFSNAYEVLSEDKLLINDRGSFYRGQSAYKALIDSLSDEREFPSSATYAQLIEKVLAFRDAISMIWDGRSYAGGFINWIASQHANISKECLICRDLLREIVKRCININDLLQGLSGEVSAMRLADKGIREKVVHQLNEAKSYEKELADSFIVLISRLS